MDDHAYFLLGKLHEDIRRTTLVIEQLHLRIDRLPFDRMSDGLLQIRRAADELDRHMRMRDALLESPRALLH